MTVETLIATDGSQDFAGWGATPEGKPAMILRVGSHKVTCEMEPAEAKELGCCAIHVGMATSQMQAAKQSAQASALVGADGGPIRGAH